MLRTITTTRIVFFQIEEEPVLDKSLSHLSRSSFIVLVYLGGRDLLKGSHCYVISKF